MGRRGRGVPAALLALTVLIPSFILLLPGSEPALADTTQSNGCASVTPGITQFSVPIKGTAPSSGTAATPFALTGTSVTIAVNSTLIAAGVSTGLVSAADSLADLGVTKNDGTPDQSAGIDAVVSAAGQVTLKITGSNTSEGVQTASNTSPVSVTFYVTADSLGGSVVVYTSVNPAPVLGGPNVAAPARTGTQLTGDLSVPIALGDTHWTPTGGDVALAEQLTTPSNLSTPTSADKTSAPLIVKMKINNAVNVGFWCWPGIQSPAPPASGTALVPANSVSSIATVTVPGGSSTTTSSSTTSTTSSSTTTSTTTATTSSTTPGSTTTTAAGTAQTSGTGGSGASTVSGSHSYTANCTNNLQPGTSQLAFTLKGTAPGQVTAGNPVTLTNQSWSVAVPGSLLTTGVNLGLLQDGQTVQGSVSAAEFASNTKEGVVTSAPIPSAFGPIHVDSVTGQAADASATFGVPNMTWTAVGGPVAVSMAKTIVNVSIGAVKVVFTCDPGINLPAFVTTAVTGSSGIPPASAVVATTSTTAKSGNLPFTGAPRYIARLVVLSLILLDLGYLAWSATVPPRRKALVR